MSRILIERSFIRAPGWTLLLIDVQRKEPHYKKSCLFIVTKNKKQGFICDYEMILAWFLRYWMLQVSVSPIEFLGKTQLVPIGWSLFLAVLQVEIHVFQCWFPSCLGWPVLHTCRTCRSPLIIFYRYFIWFYTNLSWVNLILYFLSELDNRVQA